MSRGDEVRTLAAPEDRARYERLQSLSRLLDSAIGIPGTRFRFGLDPIVGLIPGIGDAIGMIVSLYIVVQGARLGASKSTLLRMIVNVGIDEVIGSVPLIGDLFDFGWRSNRRNMALIERQLEEPARVHRSSRWFLVGLVVLLLLMAVGALWLLVQMGHVLARTFGA